MNLDDLKRIFLGPTLFRLDTILASRLVPVFYAVGLLSLLLWAVTHLFSTFGSNFGNGLWGLLEIVVYGGFGLVLLRIISEALLVYFEANDQATEHVRNTRIASSLFDDIRDAIHDIAEEDDDDDYITPATDAAPHPARTVDIIPPPRTIKRTAKRTPTQKP